MWILNLSLVLLSRTVCILNHSLVLHSRTVCMLNHSFWHYTLEQSAILFLDGNMWRQTLRHYYDWCLNWRKESIKLTAVSLSGRKVLFKRAWGNDIQRCHRFRGKAGTPLGACVVIILILLNNSSQSCAESGSSVRARDSWVSCGVYEFHTFNSHQPLRHTALCSHSFNKLFTMEVSQGLVNISKL